jgi:diketogulonate reductase-like aldo/keto reductase
MVAVVEVLMTLPPLDLPVDLPEPSVGAHSTSDVRSMAPLQDSVVTELATRYGKTPAQIILRRHIEHGLSAIPKSVKPHRIAENIDIFDFALTPDDVAAIDATDTGVRGGPDPGAVGLDTFQ